MRFIIATYGTRYMGMLVSLIYSIVKSNPRSSITVLWQDLPEDVRFSIQKTFNFVDFVVTDLHLSNNKQVRIASKLILWQKGYNACTDNNVVLLDVDMLVIREMESYFTDKKTWNIGVTHKPHEKFPLNTGLILLKRGSAADCFLEKWIDETHNIINNQHLMSMANSINYPYGAADQMSLYQIIGYDRKCIDYSLIFGGDIKLHIHAFPCRELNQTKSTTIVESTRVIHYKSGWQRVILDGYNFSSKRPKIDSWQMYIYYLRNFDEALKYIKLSTGIIPQSLKDSIAKPFYLDNNYNSIQLLYSLFAAWSSIRWKVVNITKRIKCIFLK